MDILYFHPHFTYPGGSGRFVLETGERIAKKGHNVTVIAQSGDESILKDYPHVQFEFVGGPLPNTVAHWASIPDLMKRIYRIRNNLDIDVIFPQVFPANYWGFLFKRKYPEIPCVWYCHEPSAFVHNRDVIMGLKEPMRTFARASNPVMKIVDNRLVKYADHILTNSRFTASNVKRVYNRDPTVVYPGVDIEKLRPCYDKDDFIFTTARLTKFKRIDQMLYAMKDLPDVKLYIGGDGEEMDNLIMFSKKLGVSDHVTFLGRLTEEQLHYYYSKAKAVIIPAMNEPFGLVPIEAMACGTPVIAMASGGVQETVLDGVTGYLVTGCDDLKTKIRLTLSDDSLSKDLCINARKHVEKNFTWDTTSEKLIESLYTGNDIVKTANNNKK